MFIYTYMHLYTGLFVYIGVFWLLFGLVLHHCSPRGGELPKTPKQLFKTSKYKCNIGQML